MKKFSFFIAAAICLLLCNATSSYAQTSTTYTGPTTTLNVNLSDIESVLVNDATSTVNLDFGTVAAYSTGVSSGALADHLQVVSTSPTGFVVSVAASQDLKNGNDVTIPVGDILITTAAGSKSVASGGSITPVTSQALSTTATQVLSADKGASDARFDVTYATDNTKLDDFVGKATNGNPYTTTLTYTIVAQ